MKHGAQVYVPAQVPKPQSVIFCPVESREILIYTFITLVYLSS